MTNATKWHVRPAKTDQPRHPPRLIRVPLCPQCVHVAKPQTVFMRTAKTLIRLGPGKSESSLGAYVILLVLSCADSFIFCGFY